LREPVIESAIEAGFRAGERVALVVADKLRKLGERQVPMDDGQIDAVVLRSRLRSLAHHASLPLENNSRPRRHVSRRPFVDPSTPSTKSYPGRRPLGCDRDHTSDL
jgi:hypothetical protein